MLIKQMMLILKQEQLLRLYTRDTKNEDSI